MWGSAISSGETIFIVFLLLRVSVCPTPINVTSLCLYVSCREPRLLAAQLAQKAQRRRDRACMRMDDISVIVVDVNPNNFIAIHGKTGGDGFIKGPGGGKEKCSIS